MNIFLFSLLLVVTLAGPDTDYDAEGSWGDDCAGTSQSPINIETATDSEMDDDLLLNFGDTSYFYEKRKLTREVKMQHSDEDDYGSTYLWDTDGDESEWKVLQYHWHSPSEHTIDGKQFDAELHVVHLGTGDNDGKLLVVGILFDAVGAHNSDTIDFMDDFEWSNDDEGEKFDSDVGDLLHGMEDKRFYHYSGSLTTPPCSEIVTWNVMREVQYMKHSDLVKLQGYLE